MTVLSDPVKNLAKIADFDGSGYLEVWTSIRDGGADGILTDDPVHVPITSTGITTPDLIPGPAFFRLKPGAMRRSIEGRIVIPDTATARVMDVIAAAVLVPEDTPADLIARATEAYFATNPGITFVEDSARPGLFYLSNDVPEPDPDGALAIASPTYKAAAKAAATTRLRVLFLGDSTNDGYGKPGGPDSWRKTWPSRLIESLRTELGVGAGGRGWVPVSPPLAPGNYVYTDVSELSSSNGPTVTGLDQLNNQIGIPGALWLQRGHASNVDTVRWALSGGTTRVDVVHTGYGPAGSLVITTANEPARAAADSNGDRIVTQISNPGAWVQLTSSAGNGLAGLGIVEYVGDVVSGVTGYNLSQGSMAAFEYAGWLTNGAYSTKPMITAFAPHVALICLGANDYQRGRTTAELASAMTTIRDQLVSARAGIEIVFIIRPLPNNSSGATWASYSETIKTTAASIGAQCLDLRGFTGSGLYIADNVHFTDAGNLAFAGQVLDYMKVGA
ncbi:MULTISPECIES: SGNH/GDSL hydrolase family protein [unclassified Rhodococcus (in: high G+C Gram-positive bacteria)]|uniref:SGNH/GDSL hydrolase family protein n=1 Tax=unclassified Rhodococcus (in: high G+C Gram-positive bacteria) TaxID=192944 RepID=UPI0015C5AB8E|nr:MULTISPECIES: SGNH/GDSL hydrolase family protein [unclassified Rhodococcus (in: high G+C Gram-positive bacteria)]